MSRGLHLDSSLSSTEETRFKAKYKKLIERLVKEVHFTYNEIESLLIIYHKIQKQGTHPTEMTFDQLSDFLHNSLDMTNEQFNLYVIGIIDVIRTTPHTFSVESWVRGLSLLLRGTIEEKIKYCYSVYDISSTGQISRNNMLELMRDSIIGEQQEDAEDSVRDLCEILSLKLDPDRDGKISFDNYRQGVLRQPLYLEALGPCLPSPLAVRSFLTIFTPYVRNLK